MEYEVAVVNYVFYIGVMLKNTYIIYTKVNDSNGVDKRDLISHYDFHKSIFLACIILPDKN